MILDAEEKDYVRNTDERFCEFMFREYDIKSNRAEQAINNMKQVRAAYNSLYEALDNFREAYKKSTDFFSKFDLSCDK